ncbi:MAG: MmcQ/YjbR family DNA-binding protein [Prevotella sp.]|nr:MmcQ/YjbR family DNA-binding protein [Prevotella sp.]
MNIEQVRDYALSLKGVTEDQPFGDDNITFRIEGKIFMCLWLGDNNLESESFQQRFAIKLSPERNEELRAQNTAVTPAWHWNKKHWSDIFYSSLPDELLMAWIQESYLLVVAKLPKAIRQYYL